MTRRLIKSPIRRDLVKKASKSSACSAETSAQCEVNSAYGRLGKKDIPPVNQSLASAYLRHTGDALPMVRLLASDEVLHQAARVSLADWLLTQYRDNRIKRPKRGNPDQRTSKSFVIEGLGTLIIHPDDPGRAVAARMREGMTQNDAIAWVTELFNRHDPNGAVMSEETVRRSYRRVRDIERDLQISAAIE